MPKTTAEELEEAREAFLRAFLEYEEAVRSYSTILDRISGLEPPSGDVQVLDRRISEAYYRMWRAGEQVDQRMAVVQRVKAKMDAEMRNRAALFHGVRQPWLRPPLQRRPVLIPAPAAVRPYGFGPFSFRIPYW